jgi:threonine/homoserine/homoserine lactone efflux protein
MLRARAPASAGGAAAAPAGPWRGAFAQGLLTNVLNPKVALFYFALLPQFIDAAAPHKTMVFAALGAWFIVQSYVFLSLFVVVTSPLRRWQPSATVRRALHLAGAGLFAGLAARLALVDRG